MNNNYSNFTKKVLSTKIILITAIILIAITSFIVLFCSFHGKKAKYEEYDTSYNSNNYKCSHAKYCKDDVCIYENESGVEETIKCNNNNWYNTPSE